MDIASVKLNVLVIGGGRMGKAFIKGLSHSTNHNIYLAESNIERKNELKNDFDINISNSENQIKDFLSLSDIIILCVKPQTLKLLQDDLKNKISEKQTLLSIMAGISTEKLCSSLNIENSVRIMPNTPGQLGEGISVWFSKNNINNEVKLNIETILESLGCLLYTSPSPRDTRESRMPSSA